MGGDQHPPREALANAAILDGVSPEARGAFLAMARVALHPRGERIFGEGDPADRFCLVLTGKLKITRPDENGKETIFTIVGPGELLGELSLFDDTERQATAVAVQPSWLASVANADMRVWFTAHPETLVRFASLLARRVRRLNDALEDVYGLDVATRVARALVMQGAQFGRVTEQGLLLDLDLSQEELALHVRASRERVNQVLADFTRRGWLMRDGAVWVLTDEQALGLRARFRAEVRNRRPQLGSPGR